MARFLILGVQLNSSYSLLSVVGYSVLIQTDHGGQLKDFDFKCLVYLKEKNALINIYAYFANFHFLLFVDN